MINVETNNKEKQILLILLKNALGRDDRSDFLQTGMLLKAEKIDWNRILEIAEKHSVTSLLYDVTKDIKEIPEAVKVKIKAVSQRSVLQSYHLLFLTKYLVGLLEQNGISVVLLKGSSAAVSYPTPELRKSGDIDLLLLSGREKQKEIDRIMSSAQFILEKEQHANHHVVYAGSDRILVELHYDMVEPFADRRINAVAAKQMEDCSRYCIRRDIMGVTLPVLDRPYQAYQLLLHMLQHFLRAGFGLKLLCDWVVLWNRELWTEEEKALFWQMMKESGICGFAQQITAVCVSYLGLDEKKVSFMGLQNTQPNLILKEILNAEEFGHSTKKRMVMLEGAKPVDYIREFHHQMHLNYPKTGKIPLFWPVLWVHTLVRFLKNNYTIRHVSAISILKEAGKRSKLMEKIEIFDR